MADEKVTDLPTFSSLEDADFLYGIDVSDTTDTTEGSSKKLLISLLKSFVLGDLGSAASASTTDFATAAQGTTADSAVQPGDLGTSASLNVGVSDGDVVQVQTGGKLPSLDGSNLTNVSASTVWSTITGTLSSQTDLQVALDAKSNFHLAFNYQNNSYTLALTDDGKYVQMDNGSPINLTVPSNGSIALPIGAQIIVRNVGAGQVTILPSSCTVNSSQSLKLRAQHSTATLIKVDTDVWDLAGDLEAA